MTNLVARSVPAANVTLSNVCATDPFFHVMTSMAEMERELTAERTRAGLDVARHLGRIGGRKRKITNSKIESAKKLLACGVPPRDVVTNLGVSMTTLYRWIPASPHA